MIASGDNKTAWQHVALYLRKDAPGPLTADDVADALTLSAQETHHRLRNERNLIEMALRRHMTWRQIAQAMGFPGAQAARQHYKRLLTIVPHRFAWEPPKPSTEAGR